MLRVVCAAIACGGFGIASASAADDWSGCYVGAHAGGVFSNGTTTDLPFAEGPFAGLDAAWNSLGPDYESFSLGRDSGPSAGFEAGCDRQLTLGGVQVVLGGVGDITFLGLSSLGRSALADDTNVSYDADWLASLRMRAGIAKDDLLFFASGGIAAADIGTRAFDRARLPSFGLMDVSSSGANFGWVVGAGAEWRVASNWSVSLEYLHYEFDGVTATGAATDPAGAFPRFDTDLRFDTIRVGLKWRM